MRIYLSAFMLILGLASQARADDASRLANLEKIVALQQAQLMRLSQLVTPAGTVIAWAGGTLPSGWLLCDGQTLEQSSYPSLYAALGHKWDQFHGQSAAPSGSFRLPNLNAVYLRGGALDQVGSFVAQSTAVGGLRVTDYIGSRTTSSDGNHHHSLWRGAAKYNVGGDFWSIGASAPIDEPAPRTDDAGVHSHSVDLSHGHGLAGDAETRPNSAGVAYIIKAS